jgi:hypothetical protein
VKTSGAGLLLLAGRQCLTRCKSRIELPLEFRRRVGTFDHDKIVVLVLQSEAEKFAAPVRSNRPSIS